MKNEHHVKTIYLLAVSITGLFILLFLVLLTNPGITRGQELIVLSVYIVICLLGMFAAVSPSSCVAITNGKNKGLSDTSSENKFEGHHPPCNEFENHTFTIGAKKFCSGCTGLFVGGLIAFFGTIYWVLSGAQFYSGMFEFYIGFILVLVSFLGIYALKTSLSYLKLLFNMFLVVGSFLILIGMADVSSNLSVQIFYLLLICIWILTRSSISELNHGIICEECNKKTSCNYL